MDTSMEWTLTMIVRPVGIEKVKGATLLGVLETIEKGGKSINESMKMMNMYILGHCSVKVVDLLCF